MQACLSYEELAHTTQSELNEKDLTEIYQKFRSQLIFFATKFTRDPEISADVVHDCFIKFLQKSKKLPKILSLKNYLFTMVRNHCFDLLSAQSKISKAEHEWSKAEEVGEKPNVLTDIYHDFIPEIISAMKTLPPKMQEVFRMYYLENKSYKEIGSKLNTQPGTVRNQRKKALETLQKILVKNKLD